MTYYNGGEPASLDLIHYGVKGMKWGVRKDRKGARQQARADKKAAKASRQSERGSNKAAGASSDAQTTESNRNVQRDAGVSGLSNSQLKQVNDRLQLEENYRRLTNNNPKTPKEKAMKVAKEIGQDAVKSIAKEMARDLMKTGLNKAMKRG